MRKHVGASAFAVVAMAVCIALPSSAAAATEFGDNCVAKSGADEFSSLFEISAPDNPLPIAAPSAGVITKWKISIPTSAEGRFPAALKVLRLSGATALVVGESAASITAGESAIATRIPVQAGDRLAIAAPGLGTYFCEGSAGNRVGLTTGAVPLGATVSFTEEAFPLRVPAAAVLEPDADGDGFGDETQDGCPLLADVQSACQVALDTTPLLKKGKAVVLVATSIPANVTVSGSAKLPGGASSSAKAKLAKVTKPVSAGKIVRFTLNFPAKLKSAVADLAPGRSITLKLEATTPGTAGTTVKDNSKLMLKLKGAG